MNDGRYQAMSSIHLRGEYDYGTHVVLRGPTTEAAAMVHVHVHGDGDACAWRMVMVWPSVHAVCLSRLWVKVLSVRLRGSLLTRGSRIGGRLESEGERATATTTRRRRRGRAKQ
jgi:hypothetical protein